MNLQKISKKRLLHFTESLFKSSNILIFSYKLCKTKQGCFDTDTSPRYVSVLIQYHIIYLLEMRPCCFLAAFCTPVYNLTDVLLHKLCNFQQAHNSLLAHLESSLLMCTCPGYSQPFVVGQNDNRVSKK